MVLPLLLQLFFYLFEDLTELLRLHRIYFLQSLAHEVDERVVEAGPLHVDVVSEDIYVEFKFSTICHVSELAEELLENALPYLDKDGSLR